MSVEIDIPLTNVKGHSSRVGNTFYTQDAITVDLQPLPPGVKANLIINAAITRKNPAYNSTATLGAHGYLGSSSYNRVMAIPPRASTLTITNVSTVIFYSLKVSIDLETGSKLAPWEIFALDIYAPPQDSAALQWDSTRWNTRVWNEAQPAFNTFRWNSSYWDIKNWYDPAAQVLEWQPIIDQVKSMNVTRGVSSLQGSATVGLLTVVLRGAVSDPRTLGISIGTRARLYIKQSLTRVFTGELVEASINPNPYDSAQTEVTLTFADAVGILVNKTRYGAKSDYLDGSESFTQRAHRLARSVPDLTFEISQSNTAIAPTVWETSLAKHLDALTATTGGYWTVTRENIVKVSPAQPAGAATAQLSDTYDVKNALYYKDINESWVSQNLITSIESISHAAVKTPDGWESADRTIIVEAQTATATWQGSKATVDLLTPLAGNAQRAAAQRLLKRAGESPSIESVGLKTETAPIQTWKKLAELDPAARIDVTRNGETHQLIAREITHYITPENVETRINF